MCFPGQHRTSLTCLKGIKDVPPIFNRKDHPWVQWMGSEHFQGWGQQESQKLGIGAFTSCKFIPAMFCGGDRSTVGYTALIYARHQGRSEWIKSHGISKDNDHLQNFWLCLNLLLSMSSVTLRIPQVTWSQQIHLDPLVDDFPALVGLSNCQVAKGYSP